MAKSVSKNDIHNMSEDWGKDASNGLPYSGAAVQKFIKKTFGSKMGYFHYDTSSNRYLVFADEESKDKYVENPTMTELVLGTFDAPFNYEASITMLTPSYNAVFLGSTGNYLDFTFDIKNKQGNTTGENVTVTYTFIRNATKRVVTETRRYGESVHFNIDEYILEGTNTIIVGVSGQTTLAATTAALTYQVVNLTYSDNMDISKVYNLSDGSKSLEIFLSVSGYGTKIIEWFLDGQQLDFVKSDDEVVDVTSERTKYIELSNLASGIHTIQSRAYTLINGEKFYTDTLYREFMVNNGDTTSNLVAVAANLPHSHGIVNESNPFVIYGVEQYIPYAVRFATRKTGNVSVYLASELLSVVNSVAGTESSYTITSNKSGTLALKFAVDNIEREIPVSVNHTSLNIEEIKTALSFDFRASGRSNLSVDKDKWSYEGYTGTFNGFNWNASSGWVDGSLLINSGASFSVNIAPLVNDATSVGKTLEFEFSTRNVGNDDAVICDLTTDGKGLLITASEARLTSAAGEVVNTRFKAGEVNRIAFVINRKTGVTYKGLAFIYVNGILSGAVNYGSADNFLSSKELAFVGTDDAQVELRAMRFYDTALSADNALNNYILYRDTLNEMMEVYYRNSIYAEGTHTFSPDAILHRLPVMVITGDIPTLEAATSTSTQILVDIDFTNEQDPTKNFRMTNAALRIQGTSSLAYPRKNYRFYTRKEESTLVYNNEGNLIKDKLYSFKDGAQPVDCWCLKADFAESSGTHNTGIARLWNDAMYGAIIQHKNVLGEEVNGYALRTKAQTEALNAGYEYDVRTTIDGFPIVVFYKQKASDTDLIFLGKYNFNNDKSTPSVFGFENIPNFDNSRMQCWETKDNGHPLGLFTDVSKFDTDWSEAFESRYPDTKTPILTDLKAFSTWLNKVSQSDFATEKWAHFDVYKVAAYYCYLMRFGAVDQPVKNAFLTSEDGEHFYFINYDNDTINGLINTGRLVLDPTVNRDTIGSDGEYVYAGHDSVLWNKLTADTEFMEIVPIVDNALYSAGLRYDKVIEMFNKEQADKWVERVYNQDAEYKYLLPYVNQATNNLFMLQGSRSSHRSWWLSKRFSLYDSIFLSGAYRDRNISFKCLNDTPIGLKFTITAATRMGYGYGVNNGTREVGIELEIGDSHTFTTTDILNLGDVVKVFAAANLESLDLSEMADRLAVLDCSAAADPSLGTRMKRLIVGGKGKVNTELASISGINVLSRLQMLNVKGCQGITSLDLTKQNDFRKLYAAGSGVASVDFAAGAPVDYVEFPSAMMSLSFNQLPYLTFENIVLEDGFSNINQVVISGCPNLSKDFDWVYAWYKNKTTSDASAVLEMDGIDWTGVDYRQLIELSNVGTLKLKGKVYISEGSQEIVNAIKEAFGDDVFNKKSDFYVQAPDGVYISGASKVLEGESTRYICAVFSEEEGRIQFSLPTSRQGCSIDATSGILTTTESGLATSDIVVRAVFITDSGKIIETTMNVTIEKRSYPTAINIEGNALISEEISTFTLTTTPAEITGLYRVDWTLGDASAEYLTIQESNNTTCVIKRIKEGVVETTLTATMVKLVDGTTTNTVTKNISLVLPGVVITKSSNAPLQACLYNNGLVAHEDYSEAWELALITADQLQPGSSESTSIFYKHTGIMSLMELKYCTGLTKINKYTFAGLLNINSIYIPDNVTEIDYGAFRSSLSNFKEVHINSLKHYLSIDFKSGSNPLSQRTNINLYVDGKIIKEFIVPDDVTSIKRYSFYNLKCLDKLVLHKNLTFEDYGSFYRTTLKELIINCRIPAFDSNGLFQEVWADKIVCNTSSTTIPRDCFRSSKVKEIILPDTIKTIAYRAFAYCSELEELTLPESLQSIVYDAFEFDSYYPNNILRLNVKSLTHLFNIKFATPTANPMGDKTVIYINNQPLIDSVTTPTDTDTINDYIFCNYTKITKLYITSNITTIGYGIINPNLVTSIEVDQNNQTHDSRNNCNAVIETSSNKLIVGCKNTTIPNSVTSIGDKSFQNVIFDEGKTDIIISENVSLIGSYAFANSNITSVTVNSPTISLGESCFADCIELTVADLSSVRGNVGGRNAFNSCGLQSVSLGCNTGIAMFSGCESLINVTLEDSVTELESYSFQSCKSLEEIIIPEGVTIINSQCFYQCTSLKNIVFPSSVNLIGSNMFQYCPSLESVSLLCNPSSCNMNSMFDSCVNLKSIQLLMPIAKNAVSSTFGSTTGKYTGRNTYNTGENILYVPQGATGYDTGYWLDPLLNAEKCGFTISYTL